MLVLFASVFSATDRSWAAQNPEQRLGHQEGGTVTFHLLTLNFQGHDGRPRNYRPVNPTSVLE